MIRFIPDALEFLAVGMIAVGLGVYVDWFLSMAVVGCVVLLLIRTVRDD